MRQSLNDTPDHVARMQALLKEINHPTLAVLMPGKAGVTRPTATWVESDPDPRADGTTFTASRETLSMLCDYLDARFRRPS